MLCSLFNRNIAHRSCEWDRWDWFYVDLTRLKSITLRSLVVLSDEFFLEHKALWCLRGILRIHLLSGSALYHGHARKLVLFRTKWPLKMSCHIKVNDGWFMFYPLKRMFDLPSGLISLTDLNYVITDSTETLKKHNTTDKYAVRLFQCCRGQKNH